MFIVQTKSFKEIQKTLTSQDYTKLKRNGEELYFNYSMIPLCSTSIFVKPHTRVQDWFVQIDPLSGEQLWTWDKLWLNMIFSTDKGNVLTL